MMLFFLNSLPALMDTVNEELPFSSLSIVEAYQERC